MKVRGLEMFVKGDTVYCLIASNNLPNLLIPAKCKIIDIEYNDEVNPLYVVQVLKFYDNFSFIKEYFIGKSFKYARRSTKTDTVVKDRSCPNKLRSYQNISKLEDIYNILSGIGDFAVDTGDNGIQKNTFETKERHYLAVEALFTYKTKSEMMKVFDEINEFYIFQIFRELRTFVTRKSYRGKFKFDSSSEFEIALSKFLIEGANMLPTIWKKIKSSI